MKAKILGILAGVSIFAATGAIATPSSPITQTVTQNLTTTGSQTFTFSQFNPTLGTLSGIDLIIQSSTLQGNATVTRTTGTRNISNMLAVLTIDSAAGFAGYTGDDIFYNRNPSGTFTVNATNTTRLVTVTGTTQSLIGGSPISLTLSSGSFGSYTGLGNVTFIGSLIASETQTGAGAATVDYGNFLSPTSLTLQYTYTTDPAPVPEPGQVAASILLLSGIGAYVFIRRRKKAAPAAA